MSTSIQDTKTYKVNRMHLYSTNLPGQSVSLVNLYQGLAIEENIYKPYISGTLTIFDGNGYQEIFPIMGEEHLELDISTGDSNTVDPRRIKGFFRIYNVTAQAIKGTTKGKAYSLDFISEDFFVNVRQKINFSTIAKKQTLSLTVNHIYNTYIGSVENLYESEELEQYKKEIEIEPTLRNYQIIFPNIQPFQAILMCAQRAISKNLERKGASFLFYEEFDKYHFESIEKLQSEKEKFYLVYQPNTEDATTQRLIQQRNVAEDIDILYLENFEIIRSFDVMENVQAGMYSSKLIAHDFERMQYEEYDFEYVPRLEYKAKTIKKDGQQVRVVTKNSAGDEKAIIDKSRAISIGKLATQYNDNLNNPNQNLNFISTTLNHDIVFDNNQSEPGGYKQKGIEPKDVEKYFLQRNSQIQQFDNVRVKINLRDSNTDIKVGDVVKFNLPSEVGGGSVPEVHFYYSGNYIVQRVKHTMSGSSGLMTELIICKNGLEHNMPVFDERTLDILNQLNQPLDAGTNRGSNNPEDYVEDGR